MTRQRPWVSDEGYERLHELARVLMYKATDESFDMGTWVATTTEDLRDCKTAGCAMGWAAVVFKQLRFDRGFFYIGHVAGDGYTAASELFGTDYKTSFWLFNSLRPNNRELIAKSLVVFADTGKLPNHKE